MNLTLVGGMVAIFGAACVLTMIYYSKKIALRKVGR